MEYVALDAAGGLERHGVAADRSLHAAAHHDFLRDQCQALFLPIGQRGDRLYGGGQERQAGLYAIDVMLVGPTAVVGVYSEKMLDPLRPLLLEEVLDGRHWKGGKPRFSDPEGKYSLRLAERVTALFMINKTIVKREEFEAVKDMARLAREENEALKTRIAVLEAKLGVSPSAPDVGSLKTDG